MLLTELKDAIATDPDLPDPDKADLLEQVQNLAVAQQTEEPAQKEELVRKAKKILTRHSTVCPTPLNWSKLAVSYCL